jgi:lysine-N-methylase
MLSEICREHPRYYNRIGDDIAVGVGASCPVAAELILSGELSLYTEAVGETVSDLENRYPTEGLLGTLCSLIEGCTRTEELWDEVIARLGVSVEAAELSRYTEIYSSLEYLYKENREKILSALKNSCPEANIDDAKRIMAYFLFRHLPESECRSDACALILFSLISTKIVLSMSYEPSLRDALVAYSEEIEYSTDNKDIIIEEISFNLI